MYVQTCQGSEHRSIRPHVLPQTWVQWAGPVVIENTKAIQDMKYRIQNVCTNLPRDLPSAALPSRHSRLGLQVPREQTHGLRPQLTRQSRYFREKPPKPKPILPNCHHPAFRGPAAALPFRRRSLSLASSAKFNNRPARQRKSN